MMHKDTPPPFELVFNVIFPHVILSIEPPIPTIGCDLLLPVIQGELGATYFYFDHFDIPFDNEQGRPPELFDNFIAHFIPTDVPPEVGHLFAAKSSDLTDGFWWDKDRSGLMEMSEQVTIIRTPEPPEEKAKRKEIESLIEQRVSEFEEKAEEACGQIFANPTVSTYFLKVGKQLDTTVKDFLEVLRIRHQQYLVPDRPEIRWSNGRWILHKPDSEEANSFEFLRTTSDLWPHSNDRIKEISKAFLSRIFPSKGDNGEHNIYNSISPSEWATIQAQTESASTMRPDLSEVLIATALGECDPSLGNPRLGLIEAVVALEIEVKSLMRLSLSKYQISNSAVERIARETSLKDLASVWIRRELQGLGVEDFDEGVYSRCAEAIDERNQLVHLERRTITAKRAAGHVRAIAKLVEKARHARKLLAINKQPA
jgi:hypothetical protein